MVVGSMGRSCRERAIEYSIPQPRPAEADQRLDGVQECHALVASSAFGHGAGFDGAVRGRRCRQPLGSRWEAVPNGFRRLAKQVQKRLLIDAVCGQPFLEQDVISEWLLQAPLVKRRCASSVSIGTPIGV